jgi:hypothetical protein
MADDDSGREPTSDRALNALTNLLKDVIDGLTLVELYPKSGRVSQRFLNTGAKKAVCVTDETPENQVEEDGMIWLPMDPIEFMEEERVQDVGLIYSSPPEGADQNREIIDRLLGAKFLQDNCLVILEEPAWNYTKLDDYKFLEEIEVSDYDRTKITVCQMVSAMEF